MTNDSIDEFRTPSRGMVSILFNELGHFTDALVKELHAEQGMGHVPAAQLEDILIRAQRAQNAIRQSLDLTRHSWFIEDNIGVPNDTDELIDMMRGDASEQSFFLLGIAMRAGSDAAEKSRACLGKPFEARLKQMYMDAVGTAGLYGDEDIPLVLRRTLMDQHKAGFLAKIVPS